MARAARRGRRPDRDRASRRAGRRATRSSARARASCTRWGSSTACCSAAHADRRGDAFVVAVNCGQAGGTCFCVSMGTGPRRRRGFDLALTEVLEDGRHYFVVEVGQRRAAPSVLAELPHAARRDRRGTARPSGARERAAAQMGREMDIDGHPASCSTATRAPALGRGRRPLPDLRQLHDGLPDVLLHDGRGHDRPRPASTSSATSAGTRASRSTTRTSTAAACAARRARATASG